jgi:hypothetical protein
MSKILVIEAHRILQQAIAITLYRRNGAVAEREERPRLSKETAKKSASDETESAKFIELVDVVEEDLGNKKNQTQKKKKNQSYATGQGL